MELIHEEIHPNIHAGLKRRFFYLIMNKIMIVFEKDKNPSFVNVISSLHLPEKDFNLNDVQQLICFNGSFIDHKDNLEPSFIIDATKASTYDEIIKILNSYKESRKPTNFSSIKLYVPIDFKPCILSLIIKNAQSRWPSLSVSAIRGQLIEEQVSDLV